MPSIDRVCHLSRKGFAGAITMQRRHFLGSAAVAGIVYPSVISTSLARQSATPAATPVVYDGPDFGPTLAERVARISPEELLGAIRSTPVTTPLFPADTPPIEPVVWDEFLDTDLVDTFGGVVFNTGYDENDNFLGVGVAIVHPDTESASRASDTTARDQGVESGGTLLGSPIFFQQNIDYGATLVQLDYLLIGGGTFTTGDQPTMLLRSITHTAALLSHLDGVLTDLGV